MKSEISAKPSTSSRIFFDQNLAKGEVDTHFLLIIPEFINCFHHRQEILQWHIAFNHMRWADDVTTTDAKGLDCLAGVQAYIVG